MHSIVGGERLLSRAIALALMAVGIAGCSGDTTRFNDSPFPERQYEISRAPAGHIEQQGLPPPQGGYGANQNGYGGNYNNGYNTNQNGGYPQNGSYNYPQNGSYNQPQSAAPAMSGGGRSLVSYAPANASPPYASG